MHGYGGFGYDMFGVPKDDPEPAIVLAAARGDLAGVEKIVEEAWDADSSKQEQGSTVATTSPQQDAARRVRLAVNKTKRWTEVDHFKASGFTKEWEWHGLTALAAAARAGRAEVGR